MNRRDFVLYLAMTQGIGGKTVSKILARNDMLGLSPEEFLSRSPECLREEYGLKAGPATKIASAGLEGFSNIEPLKKRLDGLGVSLVAYADAHYPALLDEMDADPPGVLFLYGNQKLLSAKTFCVLSSRNTSPAGLDQMERLCEAGVLNAEVVVAGHDTPEYQRAAVVPLRWGAPRILCLDRGMFQVLGENLRDEPFRAARLWRFSFDPSTDLVISPFRPDAIFTGVNNKVRDRLVGGLSKRLDFVEISPGGNMEKLALSGLKARRPVRVSDRSVGYRRLIESGAEVIPA